MLSPRQEERFLYPVYPSIFLSAACTLDIIVQVRLQYQVPVCFSISYPFLPYLGPFDEVAMVIRTILKLPVAT